MENIHSGRNLFTHAFSNFFRHTFHALVKLILNLSQPFLIEMYSLLLETYIKDSNEKNRLFNAVENIPCVARKAKWALNWIRRYSFFFKCNTSFINRLILILKSFLVLKLIFHHYAVQAHLQRDLLLLLV